MHDLIRPLSKDSIVKQFKFAIGLSCGLVLSGLACFGQASSLAPQIMSAQSQVKWNIGPARADLGKVAEVAIPEGYRFTDAAGARVLLELKTPSPGLVGVLKAESGAWMVVLEFAELGYVKPSTTKWINRDAILSALQTRVETQYKPLAKQGAPPIKSVSWDVAPEYNAADNTLAYALQIEAGTEKMIKPSYRFFGRSGVLVATIVQKGKVVPEQPALKELFKSVTFKTGQRYGDYQEGDKLANVDMYQLITGDEQTVASAKKGLAGFFDRKTMIWIVSGLAVCVLAAVVFLVTREIRSLNPRQPKYPAVAASNGANNPARRVRRSAKTSETAGRRRAFDYQKFYSDMMMQVSTRSYTGFALPSPDEQTAEAGETSAANSSVSGAEAQKGTASELIARQKDFIEEQRRLMQQQTKLIEERSKLIEEKNQFMAKQSEMLENHLL